MRNLLEFISKYHHWLLFFLLEAASAVLLFRYNSYQGSVWFSSANAVCGKVYEVSSGLNRFFSLSEANEVLSKRNIELEEQIAQLRRTLCEVTKDSSILADSLTLQGYNLIDAKVVHNSTNEADNIITIDKGSADGIRKDMGVISGTGIVGIVYLVGDHYSTIIPVLNSHTNISCSIRSKGNFGYLHWYKESAKEAYLEDVPRHANISKGDTIETSGYSSVFPQGITVGRVLEKQDSPDGLAFRLKVNLSTDFSSLRDVFVVDNTPMLEQLEILRATKDSISLKKK